MNICYQFVIIISTNDSSNRSNTSSNIVLLLPCYFCVSLSVNIFNQPINKVKKKSVMLSLLKLMKI